MNDDLKQRLNDTWRQILWDAGCRKHHCQATLGAATTHIWVLHGDPRKQDGEEHYRFNYQDHPLWITDSILERLRAAHVAWRLEPPDTDQAGRMGLKLSRLGGTRGTLPALPPQESPANTL